MGDPWNFTGVSAPLGSNVTLVQGSAFCISALSGDLSPGSSNVLFFRDSRFISRLELTVNGARPEALAADTTDPFSAVFVGRTRPRLGHADTSLMLFRYRYIGRGMREDLLIRNFGDEPSYCSVQFVIEADFADLFDVKEGLPAGPGDRSVELEDGGLVFRYRNGSTRRGARVDFRPEPLMKPGEATFEIIVTSRGELPACL